MAFHDVLFPTTISFGSEGGPEIRTRVTTLMSGHERRNSPWAGARRRYNAGYGVKNLSDIEAVVQFFEARHGRLHSFRWRDPVDYKSCLLAQDPAPGDQLIGIGDGVKTDFQLVKNIEGAPSEQPRPIRAPVVASVRVALDGVEIFAPAFQVDGTSGLLSLQTPPAIGVVVSAGFLFDVRVRFDSDQLSVSLSILEGGEIPSIPVIEVFD